MYSKMKPYAHLPIQSIVQNQRMREGQTMGFHWVVGACNMHKARGSDGTKNISINLTIMEISHVRIIKICNFSVCHCFLKVSKKNNEIEVFIYMS